MARQRTITPGFFRNEDLGECGPLARLLFAGLWCWADRRGRLEDRPRRLKAEILPYDDGDGESMVAELAARGLVRRYEAGGQRVLQIVNFDKYQKPHPRESPSTLPDEAGRVDAAVGYAPGGAEGAPKANPGGDPGATSGAPLGDHGADGGAPREAPSPSSFLLSCSLGSAAAARERASAREDEQPDSVPEAAGTPDGPPPSAPAAVVSGTDPDAAPGPRQPAEARAPRARRGEAPAREQADEAPQRPVLVVDRVELGPLGAEYRARVEQDLGVSLALAARGREAVRDEIERLLTGGVEPAVAWTVRTVRERARSGGPLPGSVAYLLPILRSMPASAAPADPWAAALERAPELLGTQAAQALRQVGGVRGTWDGTVLVLQGDGAHYLGVRLGEVVEQLVHAVHGARVRYDTPQLAAGGGA